MDNDQEDLLIVQLECSYSMDTVKVMGNPVSIFTLAIRKLTVAHFYQLYRHYIHTSCANFSPGVILLPKLTFPSTHCP